MTDLSNKVTFCFESRGQNVALARLLVAAMAADHDMTMTDLDEIKVAVSEAVSNAIIHGYENQEDKIVRMEVEIDERRMIVRIHDDGVGIADIVQAMQPSYSTDKERMGLGFAFMHSFMDKVEVISELGVGSTVTLIKMFN